MKASNFLQLKIYRRTFFIYLSIVIVFFFFIISNRYNNARLAGQQFFSEHMDRAFSQVEDELDGIVNTIDNFLIRLNSSPMLKKDFFYFFGATPAEYTEARLRSGDMAYESYLGACDNLVTDCNYLIRYILYYCEENVICMEYSQEGYSRCVRIEPEEGENLCRTGYAYTRDIYLDSVYKGKISFVIDVAVPIEKAFCRQGEIAVWMELQGQGKRLGDMLDGDVEFGEITESGRHLGVVALTSGKSGEYFYGVNASEKYSYLVVAAGKAEAYMRTQIKELWVLVLGLLLTFILITILYIRQFSADGRFLQDILHSVECARNGSFQRIRLGKRRDEYAVIARQLNGLYEYLEALIQQKYELTISQQRTQMQMLSSQLNPHFLYNTLERIRLRALRVQNMEVAQATANLGLLYRNIVKTEPVISLEKEIDITKQYLDLMCFLYDDQFFYHCDVKEDILDILTPKIWMQPIMENFFKHNFREDESIKVIVLTGEKCKEGVRLTFFDNMGNIQEGQLEYLNRRFTPEEGKKEEEGQDGVGLQNVYHRLWLYYRDKVRMTIRNNAPSGVCIEVLIRDDAEI